MSDTKPLFDGRTTRSEPMTPEVKTLQGKVRGSLADGIYAFKGVPYAAPPFGASRFRAPQPIKPWSGVREALAYGPKSPQPTYPPGIRLLLAECVNSGEDCLSLNIWSGELGSARQPVMVWIPGGMYAYHGTGGSPWYDGGRFARDGIVCVTLNYRVAADGFLYLDEGEPNRGLLDQVAALEWVRDNIGAFGGDPGKVTLFGESAGALSIATLLSMPRAEGLFHRAIAQSGAAQHVISVATALRVRQRLASLLGVEALRDAIAAVPIERLLQAQTELEAEVAADPDPGRWGGEVALSMMPWQPVVDGKTIPASPLDRIAAGAGTGIDLMVGTNTDENRLFLVSVGGLDQITSEALAGAIAAYGLPVEETLATYRAAQPGASAGDLLAAIQTDWCWRIPAIRLADAHARSPAGTYMYEFAWRSPQFEGLLGACHALEIPFVFDTLGHGTDVLWGNNPPQSLADTMNAAWVAFAAHGNPGWPRYDPVRRATMRFDLTSEVVDDPRFVERELWRGVR